MSISRPDESENDRKILHIYVYTHTLSYLFQIPLMQPTPEPAPDGSTCSDLNLPHALSVTLPEVVSQKRRKWAHLQASHDQARQIERETQDQTSSQKWPQERKKRMTASNFGRYLTRCLNPG